MKHNGKFINLVLILTVVFPVGTLSSSVAQAVPIAISSPNQLEVNQTLGYAPDRVIVKFKTDVQFQAGNEKFLQTGYVSLDAVLSKIGAHEQRFLMEIPSKSEIPDIALIHVLEIQSTYAIADVVEKLSANPIVEWAEPDYLAFPTDTIPNDPLYPDQWGLSQIEAPAAWDVSTGSSSVSIAIIDSGVDSTHPDLASQLWINPGEIAGNGLDDDNNGYIDDVTGWDFVNADNDPSDDHGHGTQVAGVAAATTNNALGIAGVCWHCRILPVKVMQASGVANYSDIAAGVLYAAQKGARVINISLGGYSNSSALQAAILTASETFGSVIVAGAGNDNLAIPFYPAAYDGVLAVAGTDQSDVKAGLSNFGDWVDMTAPAVAITTTFQGGDYGSVDGTSFATPFVSGVAALLRSLNPTWSAETTQAQILHTTTDIDGLNPGLEGKLGDGRVNANMALRTAAQPFLVYVSYLVDGIEFGRPNPGETVDLVVTLLNDWADANNVQATLSSDNPYVSIIEDDASFGNIPTYAEGINEIPFQISISASTPYAYELDFVLHIFADEGYTTDIELKLTTTSSVIYPPATITTQTWTNDRIYLINKETGIPTGETLTIEPGTEIRFDGHFSLTVAGELIANGTEDQKIIFTSNITNPLAGDWGVIRFQDSSIDASFDQSGNYLSGTILRNVIVKYGSGIYLENAAPYISNNILTSFDGNAIYGSSDNGVVIIDGNTIIGDQSAQQDTGIQISGTSEISGNTITKLDVGIQLFGTGKISRNSITNMDVYGIYTMGEITATKNRVMQCMDGFLIDGGMISENLLADNQRYGVDISGGTPTVISNTIISNLEAGIMLHIADPIIHNNNIIAHKNGYALKISSSTPISAINNWWGTTNESDLQDIIYDGLDEFGLGFVDYSSYLNSPETTAPAYVVDVTISPDTTLGIQTATFEVEFSRAIDQSIQPEMSFQSIKHGTWTVYNTSNSDLPLDFIFTIAPAQNGTIWFGHGAGVTRLEGNSWITYNTSNSDLPSNFVEVISLSPDDAIWVGTVNNGGAAHFDDADWTVYTPSNSGLPDEAVYAIASAQDGTTWFGTGNGGAAHFDGFTWRVYNTANSGIPFDSVFVVTPSPDGSIWFGSTPIDIYDTTGGGAVHFSGNTWTVYNAENSGLPNNFVYDIVVDSDGSEWFATNSGVAHFDGVTWTIYNTSNSELPSDNVKAIAIDLDGSYWFATWYDGVAHFDGTNWALYNTTNSGLPGNDLRAIATGPDGSHWFGTEKNGSAVLWNSPSFPISNASQWINNHTYRAIYDITSLIPRGDYDISVSGVFGTDGIEIASTVGYSFTVDYAGAIGDTTPPSAPYVTACAGVTMDTLTAEWTANDPESLIDLYSYAIGITPGGSEVINWTNTTALSFVRSGLNLSANQPYYISVKARNEGGLWSSIASPDAVYAGSGVCTTTTTFVYLSLVIR